LIIEASCKSGIGLEWKERGGEMLLVGDLPQNIIWFRGVALRLKYPYQLP
jgi:hypothetical protein